MNGRDLGNEAGIRQKGSFVLKGVNITNEKKIGRRKEKAKMNACCQAP